MSYIINSVMYGASQESPGGWYPPSDWGWDAASTLVGDSDNGFVGIHACYPIAPNYAAFTATFVGTATVDWNDGSAPEAVTSGVKIEHTFVYSGITNGITSCGFKPANVVFKSTGECSVINFGVRHTNDRVNSDAMWMCIKIRSTYLSAAFQYQNYDSRANLLKLIDFGLNLQVRLYLTFYIHKSLSKLIYNFGNNTGTVATPYVFYLCGLSEYNWNNDDWSNFTTLYGMWFGSNAGYAYGLNINIDACTELGDAFRQSSAFSSIILNNTGLVQSIATTLYNNASCQHFEMDDCSSITNTNNFLYTSGNNLKSLLLYGLTIGIDISNQPMTATALNAFFTSLGTASGAQTIIVTGCIGAATCDTSIATGKGYTVTT